MGEGGKWVIKRGKEGQRERGREERLVDREMVRREREGVRKGSE